MRRARSQLFRSSTGTRFRTTFRSLTHRLRPKSRAAEIIYQVGASGGGGTVTVTPPAPVGTTQTFTITPHLAAAGDVVQVVDNPASPTVTATSPPVTITDPTTMPKTISFSAPGTVQEASFGAGVIVNETITTTGLTGNVYEEVLTASGTIESGYTAVALTNGVGSSSDPSCRIRRHDPGG